MARPIANPITYGTLSGNVPMSDLDTSFNALFTTGFNDSSLGWVNYAADTGTANAYAVTLSVTPSSYTSGMCVVFTPQNSNTGASTINVNALGTKSVVAADGSALLGGEIPVNFSTAVVYDGVSFRIVGNEYKPISSTFTSSANQTVACDGASSVTVSYTFNASATASLTLARIRFGVPITILVNFNGFTSTLQIPATSPSGSALGQNYIALGQTGLQTGIASSFSGVSTTWIGNGISGSNVLLIFQHT